MKSRLSSSIPYLAGACYGLLYAGSAWKTTAESQLLSSKVLEGVIVTLLLPFLLALFEQGWSKLVVARLAAPEAIQRLTRESKYVYGMFLAGLLFLLGLKPSLALTLLLLLGLVVVQAALLLLRLDRPARERTLASDKYIAVLFMVSGFSALIYQVVWQRMLFTTFGINAESVTIIVSVFMAGLGIGSLAGGYIQSRMPERLLGMFLLIEIAIGVFGIFSLDVIRSIGTMVNSVSPGSLIFWVYGILAIPTLLMGATLPVLVAFLQRHRSNIGETVGLLYAFNTFGSAIAAFYTVEVLFVLLNLRDVIIIAACFNFATAALIWHASRYWIASPASHADAAVRATDDAGKGLPYWLVFLVMIAIGYISLSQEIVWYRILGFMTGGKPQVFGMLLSAFLIGVGYGSIKSRAMAHSHDASRRFLLQSVVLAAAVFYLSVPLIAQATALLGKPAGAIVAYACIALVAGLCGGILPTLMHLGLQRGNASARMGVSVLYFANIIGATFGPLVTGFILMDRFTVDQNILILTASTIFLGLLLAWLVPVDQSFRKRMIMMMAATAATAAFLHQPLYERFLEKLQYASTDAAPFKHKLENMSGILTVEAQADDIIFGNGMYDGRFNTNPVVNDNLIDRAYMMAALHRKPMRVLEIGLSSGSWARVIADYGQLAALDIVEINKGYPELIRHYPDIASVLDDKRVMVFMDDGRRWMKNHPSRKYDMIIVNTSYYWRSNMTNILSKEFLELCKSHLAPGGVMYYNTTFSPDVAYTAANVFKHVTRVQNFVAGSDSPFDMSVEERRSNLLQFRQADGTPLFEKDSMHRAKLDQMAKTDLKDVKQELLARRDLWLVTDENMAVEYKVDSR
jgi:spermidine synthase